MKNCTLNLFKNPEKYIHEYLRNYSCSTRIDAISRAIAQLKLKAFFKDYKDQ